MTKDTLIIDGEAQSLDFAAGRRAFIQNLGLGAVGAAVFGSAAGVKPAAAAALTPVDVLVFALNLEYLEATFYSYAATGMDLDAATVGAGSGAVSGGALVPFKDPIVKAYAQEIAVEEKKHVQVLKHFLGDAAVARPALNIGSAFAAAATAAGINEGAKFNAYADDTSFLLASYIFEDVGVTAYHGAAGVLMGTPYLTYAAGILAVEAYHAGLVRTSLFATQSAHRHPGHGADLEPSLDACQRQGGCGRHRHRHAEQADACPGQRAARHHVRRHQWRRCYRLRPHATAGPQHRLRQCEGIARPVLPEGDEWHDPLASATRRDRAEPRLRRSSSKINLGNLL